MRGWLAGAMLVLAVTTAEARADEFSDRVAALTGVDTPESQAADREADALIDAYQKANIKWMAEPVGPTKGQLRADADKILKQALERARAAADLRAQAANRRCLAPDAGGPAAGGDTSPYLCGAVANAKPGDAPNDPWLVCGCARRYVEGLRKEAEAIGQRSRTFIGQSWPTEEQWSSDFRYRRSEPLSAGIVSGYFDSDLVPASDRYIGRVGARNTIGGEGGWSFLTLAEDAQRRIAQLGVYQRTTSNASASQAAFADPAQKEQALLIPPARDAYSRVQEALRWTWLLVQREGALELAAIEERLVKAVEQEERPYVERLDAARYAIYSDENRSWRDKHAEIRQVERTSCLGWVAGMMPHVEEAIESARAVVADAYKARRRFLADAEAWKVFALKDGAGSGPSPSSGREFNDQDFARFVTETLGLSPHPFGSTLADDPVMDGRPEAGWSLWLPWSISQPSFGPYCSWGGFFLSDPVADYWIPDESDSPSSGMSGYLDAGGGDAAAAYDALVLQAAQARFPEFEAIGGGALLRFDLDAKAQVSEAVVSGAGVGQGP